MNDPSRISNINFYQYFNESEFYTVKHDIFNPNFLYNILNFAQTDL